MMSHSSQYVPNLPRSLIAAAVASILAACVAAPVKPTGAMEAREKLTELQSNPELATRAPAAIKEAELAVRVAETPQLDPALGQYNVYIADRKVDIAKARAETSLAEDQRAALSQQRDKARLDARTQEADVATNKLQAARAAIADSAQVIADSQQQNAELQRQLDEMHAKATDRGMVLTVGDLLFTSGKADLKAGATENLNRLVTFLNNYTDRSVMIEGYTDSTGSIDYNLGLSQRRADSVKFYLTSQGIDSGRLSSTGKGESNPIADNESASGRQQNRRVDVIIVNPAVAQR